MRSKSSRGAVFFRGVEEWIFRKNKFNDPSWMEMFERGKKRAGKPRTAIAINPEQGV
ncbi:MAG: hypothetical protein ABH883_02165 [Candidatus Omnitrophota bacterium]